MNEALYVKLLCKQIETDVTRAYDELCTMLTFSAHGQF